MNNATQNISTHGICRPYGAWLAAGAFTINMALLTELGGGINGSRLFYDQIRSHHLLEQGQRGLHRRGAGVAQLCRRRHIEASRAGERRYRHQGVDCNGQGTWTSNSRTQRPVGLRLNGIFRDAISSPARGEIFVATKTK